ncbi:hypothetical protein DVH24_039106 [Malus domestica]|uniref:Uncharacterized protein n=1 Tax=Malus domestica TaxID=3750 RepID=A0A498KGZ5_MALDO|nr:hypothetical protein DVH24_039106 [Malus domestica]
MALYNLAPPVFRLITCLKLLNQWYGANLELQEFCVLYSVRRSSDGHYFFQPIPSLTLSLYMAEQRLVKGHSCRGWRLERVRVKSVPMSNLRPDSDLKSIKPCRPQLIKCALKVLAKHHSQKW